MNNRWLSSLSVLSMLLVAPAQAASVDGASLGFVWSLPFFGLLATIALGPLFFLRTWHHHYGKIAAFWAVLAIAPLALSQGFDVALEMALHALFIEFIPFIILLFTLYTVAGGILLTGDMKGTPLVNTGVLALGAVLASVVGTTGASMILIRPLIRANDHRSHTVHLVIFFIFIVSNIGGSLTPLGDPPLFVGFLRGVDFFWTTTHLLGPTCFLCCALLLLFFAIDTHFSGKDEMTSPIIGHGEPRPLKLFGGFNIVLLATVIAIILATSAWDSGKEISLPGAHVKLEAIVRDALLLGVAALSWRLTPMQVRAGNEFSWEPILEVGKLFAAIFLCVAPVIAMLQAGKAGAFAGLVAMVTSQAGQPLPQMYFWLTGLLSAFLDNAPTYLVFFELAGGDAKELMGPLANILKAISMGAVFMGALSYIGNAPNLMVCAIAKDMKVPMPGFVGYMGWSFGILAPLLALTGWLFVG